MRVAVIVYKDGLGLAEERHRGTDGIQRDRGIHQDELRAVAPDLAFSDPVQAWVDGGDCWCFKRRAGVFSL